MYTHIKCMWLALLNSFVAPVRLFFIRLFNFFLFLLLLRAATSVVLMDSIYTFSPNISFGRQIIPV